MRGTVMDIEYSYVGYKKFNFFKAYIFQSEDKLPFNSP